MRRYVIAVAALLALALVHMIVPAGSAEETEPAASGPVSRAQPSATASTFRRTATQTLPTVVTRPECRWRRYADGAIGTDPDCAPGALNLAVPGPRRTNDLPLGLAREGGKAPATNDPHRPIPDRLPAGRQPRHLRRRSRRTRQRRWQRYQCPEPLPAAAQRLRRADDAHDGRRSAPGRHLRSQDHYRRRREYARRRLAVRGAARRRLDE